MELYSLTYFHVELFLANIYLLAIGRLFATYTACFVVGDLTAISEQIAPTSV
jgi:hypothetical protein